MCGAYGIYVAATGGCCAASVAGGYWNHQRERCLSNLDSCPIHSIFNKRRRRLSWILVIEETTAVTSGAVALIRCVEGAAVTPPESARSCCSCGNVNPPSFALSQRLTATYGISCGPYRVWTLFWITNVAPVTLALTEQLIIYLWYFDRIQNITRSVSESTLVWLFIKCQDDIHWPWPWN